MADERDKNTTIDFESSDEDVDVVIGSDESGRDRDFRPFEIQAAELEDDGGGVSKLDQLEDGSLQITVLRPGRHELAAARALRAARLKDLADEVDSKPKSNSKSRLPDLEDEIDVDENETEETEPVPREGVVRKNRESENGEGRSAHNPPQFVDPAGQNLPSSSEAGPTLTEQRSDEEDEQEAEEVEARGEDTDQLEEEQAAADQAEAITRTAATVAAAEAATEQVSEQVEYEEGAIAVAQAVQDEAAENIWQRELARLRYQAQQLGKVRKAEATAEVVEQLIAGWRQTYVANMRSLIIADLMASLGFLSWVLLTAFLLFFGAEFFKQIALLRFIGEGALSFNKGIPLVGSAIGEIEKVVADSKQNEGEERNLMDTMSEVLALDWILFIWWFLYTSLLMIAIFGSIVILYVIVDPWDAIKELIKSWFTAND